MFEPLYDKVVLKRNSPDEQTPSGIIIPKAAGEVSQYAEVIAVGEGRMLADGTFKPMAIKVGDKVFISKFVANVFYLDEEEYLLVNEAEIYGVFK